METVLVVVEPEAEIDNYLIGIMKYILKESELREIIREAVEEELKQTLSLNEGIGRALGGLMKVGAGIAFPMYGVSKFLNKAYEFPNWGGSSSNSIFKTGSKTSKEQGQAGRKSKAERQRERAIAGRSISYEYGRPETVPGIGRRTRLANKSEITAPQTNSGIDWGTFGRHYHDEGDRVWNRKINDTENALIRNSRGNERRMRILQRRYKRILIDWLKDRDREYKTYIQSIN